MSNELTHITQSSTEISTVGVDLLTDYLDAMGLASKLTAPEKKQFLHIAQHFQLNPFKREIYATKYADQFSIIVGYEVYLKRAERSGQLDGWKTEFTYDDKGNLFSCVITIYRKDRKHPFEWEVFYDEQVQTTKDGRITKFWQKGRQQLRKVAISQGFRIAFPDELGGMPYTSDELGADVQETTAEVVQDAATAQTVEAKVTETAKPKMTKRQLAETAKEDARFKDYQKSIGICKDDQSYDYNESNIANDEVLSNEQKASLIKESIMVRTAKVTYVEQAEVVKKRIGGWAKLLGTPDVTALLNDLIEQAAENGIKYENKKFYVPEPVEEVEAEEVNG